MLTLPIAKILKDHFPDIYIAFLGRSYTKAVIDACEYVDEFIDLEDFLTNNITINGKTPEAILHVFPVSRIAKRAKELKIPFRIGTTNRLYHWFTCNKLIKLSRKNSSLHEAQLNIKLLAAFNINTDYSLSEIQTFSGFNRIKPLPERFKHFISNEKYNLILHPKSQGSAREWGLENFIALIKSLDKNKFNILISGTSKERALLDKLFDTVGAEVTDITGLMTLEEFIAFINACDGLIANSTGPLHIAAALGKDALGIYPPIRPMHPGRWAPLGKKTKVFVLDKSCDDCRNDETNCICIKLIDFNNVKSYLEEVVL